MVEVSLDAQAVHADVVLVSCYELGHEPLGITVPAGVLSRAGFPVRLLDVAVDDFDAGSIARARLVAISTPMHTALRLGARVAARVRELNPEVHVCFFGLYAGLNAARLVPHLADSCLGAECEAELADLARRVVRDERDTPPRRIAAHPSPHSLRRPRSRTLDLSPARDGLRPSDRYVKLASLDGNAQVGYVQSTRGCKHLCRHCPVPAAYGGAFYAIPVERVLEDVERVVARGARHVTFADADFLNGPGHALRVTRAMHQRFPHVTFDYTAKIEHLQRCADVVEELQSYGNLFVVSAVESLNDEVLHHLAKGHTREDVIDVVRHFRRIGLALRPSLVPFTPWETRESLVDLLETIAVEQLIDQVDPVQYAIRLLVPEGSLLLESESMRAHLGDYDPETFTYRWTHPDPSLDALQRSLATTAAEAAQGGLSTREAFTRIREAVAPEHTWLPVPAAHRPAPRLTEDWFC